jgi:hypothetical protein
MAEQEDDMAEPVGNDPGRIVPQVYARQRSEGLDHLDAYRTAVETYREIRPGATDGDAAAAVTRILADAGIVPLGTTHRR